MDRSAHDAVVAAVRATDGALVVAGGAEVRLVAAETARSVQPVVEVGPVVDTVPWGGLAAVLDACRRELPSVRVPAAIEAAATGRPVGDHLGLAADLRALLTRIGEDGDRAVLVPEAHRMDLSSAAALSHALADRPAGVRVVITQDRSGRGVAGVPRVPPGDGPVGDGVAPTWQQPMDVDGARRWSDEAAEAGAVLDAAAGAEALGDWAAAARWWFEGGRPERCRRALEAAGDDPRAAEVAVRLAHRTASDRSRRVVSERAIRVLDSHDSLAAVRLRLLEAGARVGRGDATTAAALVATAADALDAVERGPAERAARELLELVRAVLVLIGGGGASPVMRHVERPLARLGAGGLDADAVQLLGAAAMALGRAEHLDEARSILDPVLEVLDARRRFVLLAQPLATSAWLARRRGRLELALTHGARAIEIARACGWVSEERLALVEVAHVEAVHGRLDDCRRHVASLVPPGEAAAGAAQLGAVSALAVGELLADEPDRAVELLEPVHLRFGASPTPGQTAWRHNLVEAYLLTGRRAEAEAVLGDLVRATAAAATPRERGHVAWCQGVLAPEGEHDAHFAEAHRLLAPYPTVRWRSDLHHLRRLLEEGRHAEAAPLAATLESEATAAGLLAPAAQLRRLRRRHGIEVPDAGPTTRALSVEDLRVALALAEGADVEDIATLLRLTTHTVETARDRIMGLLGVDAPQDLARFLPNHPARPTAQPAVVRVLGPTVVQRGAERLVPPAGRPAAVLALVATEGSTPVERVLDVLWPDVEPERSRSRLRNVLARLRAAVGGVVERDGDRLVLGEGVEVDARTFERLAEEALRPQVDDVLARTAEAIAAWGGEPLVSWPYDDWALRERHRLVQRCAELHVRRADVLVARGAVGAALDELELAVGLQPDARDLWERAIGLAEADARLGRARALRRQAAVNDIELV